MFGPRTAGGFGALFQIRKQVASDREDAPWPCLLKPSLRDPQDPGLCESVAGGYTGLSVQEFRAYRPAPAATTDDSKGPVGNLPAGAPLISALVRPDMVVTSRDIHTPGHQKERECMVVWNNLLAMVAARGYVVKDKTPPARYTDDSGAPLLQIYPLRTGHLLCQLPGGGGGLCQICMYDTGEGKFTTKDICEASVKPGVTHLIFVAPQTTPSTRKFLFEFSAAASRKQLERLSAHRVAAGVETVEFMLTRDLLQSPTRHVLAAPIQIMPSVEAARSSILGPSGYQIEPLALPKMYTADKLCMWYGIQPGAVVLTQGYQEGGIGPQARLCVAGRYKEVHQDRELTAKIEPDSSSGSTRWRNRH